MSVSLSIISWILLFSIFLLRGNGYRKSFLTASVAWGCLLTALFELLSLGGVLNHLFLAISWGVAVAVEGVILRFMPKAEIGRPSLPQKALLLPLGAILPIAALTALTAVVAPPGNWDSMTYHLARVMHWIQDGSIAHFPTHVTRQLYSPPWAEFAVANTLITTGGDYMANLVQWFAMLGSVIAVSVIALQLGAGGKGQTAAAALCAAIPMGILQASSTQNDYVAAFWLACFVSFGLQLKEKPEWGCTILTGASLGLALLTKGAAYVYALPFILWFLLSWLKQYPKAVLKHVAAVILIGLALNIGHYSRNYRVFGNPLSTDSAVLTNEVVSLKALASNAARNFTAHFITTSDRVNNSIGEALFAFHNALGIDIHDPRSTYGSGFGIVPGVFHEDYAGNPLHVVLIIISVLLAVSSGGIRRESPLLMRYMAMMCLTALLYCLVFKWQIWGNRLQLSMFVLWTPFVATVLARVSEFWCTAAATAVALCGLFWCVGNQTKPMTGAYTIFSMPRADQYFSSNPPAREKYAAYADSIVRTGCMNVGLIMNEDAYEYPLWALVRERGGRMPRMEHVSVTNRSSTIPLKKFTPSCTVNIM